MKKIIVLTFIALFLSSNIKAQQQILITDFYATVRTTNFEQGKQKITDFIKEKNCVVVNQNEKSKRFTSEFLIDKKYFDELDQFLPQLGYVAERKLTTSREINKAQEIKKEIEYLKKRKEAYEKELTTMVEKTDRYYQFWNEVRNIEARIYEKEKDLQRFEITDSFLIIFTLEDETYDLYDEGIDWVNMPGVSFHLLFTENPNLGISADQYMGYALKYMFTRGKTYANLGSYRQFEVKAGSTPEQEAARFKELFLLGFGQDFYTRYFGRGKNKFFNLYSGYNFGGIYATSDNTSDTFLYIQPSFGVELFKNKYILLDNRVEYFVPFKYNRELRGIMYTASFNFVF